MQTKTVENKHVCYTVHEENGFDVLAKRRLLAKVYIGNEAEIDEWYEFIEILCQSDNVSVPFAWPSKTANIEELREARDAFLNLPGSIYREWKDAITEVNTPP